MILVASTNLHLSSEEEEQLKSIDLEEDLLTQGGIIIEEDLEVCPQEEEPDFQHLLIVESNFFQIFINKF